MKKFIITEEEKSRILGMHQEHGYNSLNESPSGVGFGPEMNGLKIQKSEQKEQDVEQINDPKIINAVNKVLKKLMEESPKFSTDDTLFSLIEKGDLIKAYRLHRNLNASVNYVDYELLDDMLNNSETKDSIVKLLPNIKSLLTNYFS
jgi:hypothetical protein